MKKRENYGSHEEVRQSVSVDTGDNQWCYFANILSTSNFDRVEVIVEFHGLLELIFVQ